MITRRLLVVVGVIFGLLAVTHIACSRNDRGNVANEERLSAPVEDAREAGDGVNASSDAPHESQLKGLPAVVQANNRFALDLYSRLRSTTPGNVFFSPYSIYAALAMTYAGASGETQSQMAKVLHITVPESEMHQAMGHLREALLTAKGYKLRVANRLWGQKGREFRAGFLDTTGKYYAADLGTLDFSDDAEAARREINGWVERQTEGKIKDLLGPGTVNPQASLVLANAIYFKADWMAKFRVNDTDLVPFHSAPDKNVTARMMQQTGRFGYRSTDDLQVLEMPYAEAGLSMIVLLPKAIEGLAELEKNLTETNLQTWIKGLQEERVIVYLPSFATTSQWDLKDALSALGMPFAFDPKKADLSRTSQDAGVFISAVAHRAYVDVNEEGTVAAAATAVEECKFDLGFGKRQEPPVFRADHPFLFLIRDNRTGSILFAGRVTNPKE